MLTVEELSGGMMLSRLTRALFRIHAMIEAELREGESPLTPRSAETLRLLAMHGQCTRAQLARLLGVRPQSMRRLLNELESDGWLERRTQQGREIACAITPAGAWMLKQALGLMQMAQDKYFRGVTQAEQELLLAVVNYGAGTILWDEERSWAAAWYPPPEWP
jgi:DNA-binding MarR family transcriptional regulator